MVRIKALRKKDGHVDDFAEHVAKDKKAMEKYGWVILDQEIKKPEFEPKEVQETEQKLVTVFELDELQETVETKTEHKKRGRKAKN